MIWYLDTSVLVALLAREDSTPRIKAALQRRQIDSIAISDWVIAEFSSAISLKVRAGRITETLQREALEEFALLSAESFDILPVSRTHFRTAALYSNKSVLNLRAPDALHLAICADHSAMLCSLDHSIKEAAIALGIPVAEL